MQCIKIFYSCNIPSPHLLCGYSSKHVFWICNKNQSKMKIILTEEPSSRQGLPRLGYDTEPLLRPLSCHLILSQHIWCFSPTGKMWQWLPGEISLFFIILGEISNQSTQHQTYFNLWTNFGSEMQVVQRSATCLLVSPQDMAHFSLCLNPVIFFYHHPQDKFYGFSCTTGNNSKIYKAALWSVINNVLSFLWYSLGYWIWICGYGQFSLGRTFYSFEDLS